MISASLDACLRPSRTSQPKIRTMTRHSRRAGTNRDLALTRRPRQIAAHRPHIVFRIGTGARAGPDQARRAGNKDDLKRRIDAAFVDGDQLCLSPQCGLSSTKEGNDLTAEQQWANPALIVETAQEVWGT
jgi:hypothetical protein